MVAKGLIDITDLTGGICDAHPSVAEDNEVIVADQCDFWESDVLSRRPGTTAKSTGRRPFYNLYIYRPDDLRTNQRLISIEENGTIASFDPAYTRTVIVPSPADTPALPGDAVFLHNKLFAGYMDGAATDRLHVYDGTTWRRAGLAAPGAAPTVANTGGGAYPAVIRYYRQRYTVQSGGVTILRSEPSAVVSFTPSGAGTAARVTKAATISEGETHWELEASADNANFYRIATTVVGTTTYDDSALVATYATTGILTEDAGDYSLIPNYRWLTLENDRLILGARTVGSSLSTDARVSWTQLPSQTGVGNDERLPTDVANFIDLDQNVGGPLTGLRAYDNKIVAFKAGALYILVRSGLNANAYVLGEVVKGQGAIPFTVVIGQDSQSRNCLYFLDPYNGPSIHGPEGTRALVSRRLLRRWRDYRNLALASSGLIQAAGVYHPDKKQVWWDVDYSGSDVAPSYGSIRWILDVMSGGITTNTVGPFANSETITNFSQPSGNAMVAWLGYPHIGTFEGTGASNSRLLRCDDASSLTDMGTGYRTYLKTKAYVLAKMDQGSVVKCVVEGYNTTAAVTLTLSVIKDYGIEQADYTFTLPTTGSFTTTLDNVVLAEAKVVQFVIGNPSGFSSSQGVWHIHRLTFQTSSGGAS